MISVCIPIYNYDVNQLVNELLNQFNKASIPFEILLLDDGSVGAYAQANLSLKNVNGVEYFGLKKNSGRIAARRMLAEKAQYDWILFLDADSQIISPLFVKNYLSKFNGGYDVISGGRVYSSTPPLSCNKMLHWKYGKQRERNRSGHTIFMTNNFCIRKTIFQQITFPSKLIGYGHEDTWLGIQIDQIGANKIYIENPVLHDGLEEASFFIEKSKNALKNLLVLEELVGKKKLCTKVRLYKYYNFLPSFVWRILAGVFNKNIEQKFLEQLYSCNPSLLLFDFYRLLIFSKVQQQISKRV